MCFQTRTCDAKGRQTQVVGLAVRPSGAEVTDIYSGTFYDMDQSARAAKCEEYEFLIHELNLQAPTAPDRAGDRREG